jgi:hypothetical protein
MKALSILQPWAWLIIRPDITDPAEWARPYADGRIKDIENRTWRTAFRGRVLIHAGKTLNAEDYKFDRNDIHMDTDIVLPEFDEMKAMTGGIVGVADIVDCVSQSNSRWKTDRAWGFVLTDAAPCPFIPLRGQLSFFDVDGDLVREALKVAE